MQKAATPDDGDGVVTGSAFRRSPIYWIVVCGALLISAIGIGTALMVGTFRDRALENGKRELESIALLLSRHFDQQLEEASVVQQDIINYMESFDIRSEEDYRLTMSNASVHAVLKSKVSAMSYVGALSLVDSDGKLINTSGQWPPPSVHLGDRHYFKRLKSNPKLKTILSEPLVSRVTGALTITLSRRLETSDGTFLGVVSRGIEPSHFAKFFTSLTDDDASAVSMFHTNGILLARYPDAASLIGKDFSNTPIFQEVLSRKDHGTIRMISPVDSQDRLTAVRTLPNFPIAIATSKPITAVLADWKEQTWFLIQISAIAAIVTGLILFLIIKQISRHHRLSRERLKLEKKRLASAVNNMTQGLLLFDKAERLVTCNQQYLDMYNLSPDIAKPGLTLRELIGHRKEVGSLTADVDEYCATIRKNVVQGGTVIIETPNGRSILISERPILEGGWLTTHEDITERRRVEEHIAHLAHYDALTNLPNRVLFREKLEEKLVAASTEGRVAVLYIDIDEFKSVNDSLGHQIGDELLKAVADRLRSCVRDIDIVARLGGDEFAIIMDPVKKKGDIVELVARLYESIRAPFDCLEHRISTDASIGVAISPHDGNDIDQLLKNADLAMYSAKEGGRRNYRFFEPEMEARMKARHTLELDLRNIIESGDYSAAGFEVHYQPLVNLADGNISGCEALLRWNHPKRGAISPAEFIPVAEETGLINQLGEWVLATACTEAATWPDHLKLAVNISPVQFKSQTIALKVATTLASSGFSASRLELEITEAVLIRDDETALTILHQLRAMGVRIALDDFGTGYSSLSYLQRFPFDKIKIDRCFMSDIEDAGGSIVSAVVNIATARKMTTTAEGVETERQRELLRTLGCTEMQGYLFSAAKPATEIRRMLNCDKAEPEALFGFSAA